MHCETCSGRIICQSAVEPLDVTNTIGGQVEDESPNIECFDEHRFRRFADNLPLLCWMANRDGSLVWFNRRWHEYCGSTPEEMVGDGWHSVYEPEVLPAVITRWKECLSTGQATVLTFPLRRSDGVFRAFRTRIAPEYGAAGGVAGWCGVSTDITDQIAAEAELRASNARLQALVAERDAMLDQLTESVIVTDAAGRITFVNDAAAKLHGVARLDVAPEDYAETYSLFTMDGEPHPVETLPLTRAVRDQATVSGARWRIRRPDSSEVLAIGNAQPFYGGDRALLGAVLTIHDDTARFAAEQALTETARIKEVLLQEVNHRVKNSLQLVASLLGLQAQGSNSPELKRSLDEATSRISAVGRLHHLLYQTETYDSVELTHYLGELARDMVATLDDRVKFELDAPDKISFEVERAIPLALVVCELLTNALKYAFEEQDQGTIILSIRREEKAIVVTLGDDGRGLPEGFDRKAGTSLGHRIVTALVRQIGATLEISKARGGVAFDIRLPAPNKSFDD